MAFREWEEGKRGGGGGGGGGAVFHNAGKPAVRYERATAAGNIPYLQVTYTRIALRRRECLTGI